MKGDIFFKTDLEIVTVDDLDGESPVENQGRNYLREKTFNSELNSLVNKIFDNEKMGEKPSGTYIEINQLEKDSLLLQCEKLIYKLKHSDDICASSSFYNPFDTDINVYDDIDDTEDYIKSGLYQCGFSRYQIFKYNFNDKAFRSDINLLDLSYSTDIYFSVNDPLILNIRENTEGFIIKPDLIYSDPFFSKKFLNKDTDHKISEGFYILRISSLFCDFININTFESRVSSFEEYLSPLLLIELDGTCPTTAGEIFGLLKEIAALPLMMYFLKNRIKFSINSYSYEDTLLMIELFIRSSINSKLKSYVITSKDYSRKENLFILKFVLSKIKRIMRKNSLIIRISINKAVIITPETEAKDIYNIINIVNSGDEIIDMYQIDNDEYLKNKEFVNLFL